MNEVLLMIIIFLMKEITFINNKIKWIIYIFFCFILFFFNILFENGS